MQCFQSMLEIVTQKSGQQNVLLYQIIQRDLPVGNVITFYVPYQIPVVTLSIPTIRESHIRINYVKSVAIKHRLYSILYPIYSDI